MRIDSGHTKELWILTRPVHPAGLRAGVKRVLNPSGFLDDVLSAVPVVRYHRMPATDGAPIAPTLFSFTASNDIAYSRNFRGKPIKPRTRYFDWD